MRMRVGDLSSQSHPKDFCRVCKEFDSGEILEWAQSLARNGHMFMWLPHSIRL